MSPKTPPYVPHVLQALGYLNDAKGSKVDKIVEQVSRKATAENNKELLRQQNDQVAKAVMYCVKSGILIKHEDRILFNLDVVRGRRSGRKGNTSTDAEDDSKKVSFKNAAKTTGRNISSDESTSSSSNDTSVKRLRKTTVRKTQTRKRLHRSPNKLDERKGRGPFRLSNLFDSTRSLRNATIAKRQIYHKPPLTGKTTPRVGRGRPKRSQLERLNNINDDRDDNVGLGIFPNDDLQLNSIEAADSNISIATNEDHCGNPDCLCSLKQDDAGNENKIL